MFDSLHEKLEGAFKSIRGRSVLNEKDIAAAMKAVRFALLEADVHYRVAKQFCQSVAEKAQGEEVLKSLTPDQQVIKIVHEELKATMGAEATELELAVAPPAVFLLVGLQGSGKTTTTGKLGRFLRDEKKRRPLLVPADVYRPAAITQLQKVAHDLSLDVFESTTEDDPVDIAERAVAYARTHGHDVVVIDTAGRLQIDSDLMAELQEISSKVDPTEILLVADAMTGQEAVNVAEGFQQELDIDGLILTKLDGDARGGAALSMKAVTGCPIKLIGVGEKLDALEVFHPERMASRILGMGDMLSFIEKAAKEVDVEESLKLQKKLKKNAFTLDDFLQQLRMVRKMGSMSTLTSMIPGMNKLTKDIDEEQAEKQLRHIEAIILSMTPKERNNHGVLNGSRRRRIAQGSGTSVQEVNQLLKQFVQMKKMMSKISKGGLGNLMQGFGGKGLGSLMKNFPQ